MSSGVNASVSVGAVRKVYKPDENSALVIFCLLGMGCIVRSVVARFKIPISDKLALMGLGAAYAYFSINNSQLFGNHNNILSMNPEIILAFWLPMYIYTATYNLDTYLFFKNVHRILLLSVFSTLVSAALTGLIVIPAINHGNWTLSQALLFGAICSPVNPYNVVIILRDLVQSKELCCILESEFLIGNGTLFVFFETMIRIINQKYNELDEILFRITEITFGELCYGYLCGRVVSFFVHFVSQDIPICLGFTLSSTYAVFLSARLFLDLPGYFTIFVTVFMLNLEKNQLTVDLDKYITKFWELLLYISHTTIYIYTGSITVTSCNNCVNLLDYAYITVTYVVTYTARFSSIIIITPIFSSLGQQWNWQSTLIAIWSGSKSAISILMAAIYLNYEDKENPLCRFILTHIVGLIAISLLINGQTISPILRISGLLDITRLKQINLNNCLKLIMCQQRDTIRILKMHKFYTDANWPVVKSTTFLRYSTDESKVEDDDLQLRKNVSNDNSRKDDLNATSSSLSLSSASMPSSSIQESTTGLNKSAKLKIIHLRKQSYSRQLEYGKISMDAFKILSQSVFVALDKEDSQLEIQVLKALHKRKRLAAYFIEKMIYLMECEAAVEIKIPRRTYRRICYKIVQNTQFQVFVYVILIADAIEFMVSETEFDDESQIAALISMILNILFFSVYLSEFILKILAHSYIYIWKHGLKFYFQSHWNKIEFVVLLMAVSETLFEVVSYFKIIGCVHTETPSMELVLRLLSTSVFLRFLFKMVQGFKVLMPKFINYFESKIDEDFSLAYDIGQGLVNAENEIIEVYGKSSDANDYEIRVQAEKDRTAISNILCEIQKNRPWIPITVKTRQAVQTILSDMKKSTYELKNAGRLNDAEFKIIDRKIEEQFEFMRKNIKKVEPCSPAEMFREIPWISGDDEMAMFLYANIEQYAFKPGDHIAKFNEPCPGIFIVVAGLFKLIYEPNQHVLDHLEAFGALPVVDYKGSYRFENAIDDYIVCGNSIGNIAILTNRPYSCSILAEIPSIAYFIPIDIVHKGITKSKHKIQSLDSRMWKDHASSLAISLLAEVPAYDGTNLEEMKFSVERSFVPSLKNFEIFIVCELIEDIILIYGSVQDFDTKEIFIAPCYIPRDVQKLVPKEFTEHNGTVIEPKLLIIPIKDVYDFEVMEKVEEISIMVNSEFPTVRSNSTTKFRKSARNAALLSRARKSLIYGLHHSQILSDFSSITASSSCANEDKNSATLSIRN